VVALVLWLILGAPTSALVHSRALDFALVTAMGELAFGVAVLLWVRVVHQTRIGAVGSPRRPVRDVATGVVVGGALTGVALVAGFVVVTVYTALTGHAPHQPDQIPTYVRGAALALSGVAVVLGAPFGEELLFRGFLYNALRRRWAVWPSALVSGILFALLHGAPVLILAIFPVGVGLALVYERRQSILASMAAHATFNLIGFITIVLTRR
jgi:membrane protease YdiL (CAAX protease family)